nr:pectin acetylesterase-family hydrolase [Kofleriaceae bacterium]
MRAAAALAVIAACGGGHGTSDAAGVHDSGPAAGDAMPLSATPGTWTYFPDPATTCGDGSPAGLAINPAPAASTDLVVLFDGGGACWDATTCFTLMTAANVTAPYTQESFAGDESLLDELAILQRTADGSDAGSATVFATANFAYVPYCTGDLGIGTKVTDYGSGSVHHTGATNAAEFARTLRATFPTATRIWLIGIAEGGYAATFDVGVFAAQFPGAELDVLEDSSPFVPVLANYATWQASWGVTLPASLSDVIGTTVAAFAATRIGLVTSTDDQVIESLLGYAGGQLAPALDTLTSGAFAQPTTHVFEVTGDTHVQLVSYDTLATGSGTSLSTWITQWATGDAAWANAE